MSRGQAIGRLFDFRKETIPSNPKGHLYQQLHSHGFLCTGKHQGPTSSNGPGNMATSAMSWRIAERHEITRCPVSSMLGSCQIHHSAMERNLAREDKSPDMTNPISPDENCGPRKPPRKDRRNLLSCSSSNRICRALFSNSLAKGVASMLLPVRSKSLTPSSLSRSDTAFESACGEACLAFAASAKLLKRITSTTCSS